ncbi:MAG: hypothetical protein ACUVQD_00890 [Thermaceae bacterium]
MRLFLPFFLALGLAQAYLPLEAGQTWTYTDGTVQKVVERKGEVAVLEYRKKGAYRRDRLVLREGIRLSEVGLPREVLAYTPPLLLLPARLEVGASWSSQARSSSGQVALSGRVEGVEGVEVPYGRFNAYRLRLAYTTEKGGVSLLELYLVPGVGVVRYLSGGKSVDLIQKTP